MDEVNTMKNPLFSKALILFCLFSFSGVSCPATLGIDIETSGSHFVRNGILSIGCSLQDENSDELESFHVNLSLPEDREYEPSCLENFWLKHPEAHAFVQTNPLTQIGT